MKKRMLKIIAIILLITTSICMIACGNNYGSNFQTNVGNGKENTKGETSNSYYLEYAPDDYVIDAKAKLTYDIHDVPDCHKTFRSFHYKKSLIDYINSKKNKDVQMEVKVNEYNQETLYDEILNTNARVLWSNGQTLTMANGNIYDIDDKYIYIVTTTHCLNGSTTENNLDYLSIKFIDNKIIKPIYAQDIIENTDCALIVIKKDDVDETILPLLKSINTSNMYQYKRSSINLYGTMYRHEDRKYHHYYGRTAENNDNLAFNPFIDADTANTEKGTSGGGLFDIYGNYYGYVASKIYTPNGWLPSLYNEIVRFNPNYGEKIEENEYYTIVTFEECE